MVVMGSRKHHGQVTLGGWTFALVSFLTIFSFGLLAWWQWGPLDPPLEPMHAEQHSATYVDGDIRVRRLLLVRRATTIIVVRNLLRVQDPGGVAYGVSLPPFSIHTVPSKGTQIIDRQFDLPYSMPSGVYELRSVIVYKANPLRDGEIEMPVVKVRIP